MKNVPQEFDDIRCYNDSEVKSAVDMLLKQPAIHEILTAIMGYDHAKFLIDNLAPMKTIEDAQREFILVLFSSLEHRTCKEVRLFGTENINRGTGHIFISNHRDIVLDATFLNVHLFFNGYDTTHIGIGNNLLIYPWVECIMRLNKSFIVRRDGSIKEQLLISKHLSSYIRYVIEHNLEGVWLAQREGRAKDSSDHTQTSILKMLGMSSGESLPNALRSLHIHPTAIHYEFDPCDYLKAREAQLKRDKPDYAKTPQDDFLSMKTGLMGYKGLVTLQIAPELQIPAEIDELPRAAQAEALAKLIDREIHSRYRLLPKNFAAADLLEGGNRFADRYTAEDRERFVHYVEQQVQRIDLEQRDDEFLRTRIIEMYANPAINQDKALHQQP